MVGPPAPEQPDLPPLLAGDRRAWAAFTQRWAALIHGAVRRRLAAIGMAGAGEGVAEDIVQETFVRLCRDDFRLLRHFDPARAAFATWLTLIATSAAADHLRRQRRWARTSAGLGGAEAIDDAPVDRLADDRLADDRLADDRLADDRPGADDAGTTIEIPPGLLSPRQALVLSLLYDKDMDVPEAAQVMGVNAQTVRSTHHKALEKLRRHYGVKK